MIYGNVIGGPSLAKTYILQDADGNELVGVLVDKEVVFTATENDIRAGAVAATGIGVTVGTKEIPSYHTSEGTKVVTPGSAFDITLLRCDYTKLQVLICAFNTSLNDSVATEKVSINGSVYEVESTTKLSSVTVDVDNSKIMLGITNTGSSPYIMRYFTYKEEY